MTTTRATRSIEIDAPVERVFSFITDPVEFMAAVPPDHQAVVSDIRRDPEGVITDFRLTETSRLGPWHLDSHVDVTVQERLPYERYVERDSTGLLQTVTLERLGDGTRLTLALEVASRIPWLDKVGVFLVTGGRGMGRGVEMILTAVKEALEAEARQPNAHA